MRVVAKKEQWKMKMTNCTPKMKMGMEYLQEMHWMIVLCVVLDQITKHLISMESNG